MWNARLNPHFAWFNYSLYLVLGWSLYCGVIVHFPNPDNDLGNIASITFQHKELGSSILSKFRNLKQGLYASPL